LLLFVVYLTTAGFSGCNWFGTSPENGKLKLVWKTKLYTSESGQVTGRFPNVLYNNKIYITMAQVAEYETKLVGLDIQTGKQLWEWKDFFLEKEEGDFRSAVQFENKIVFAWGGRHYCINAETGKTVWRNKVNTSTSFIMSAIGNKYLFNAVSFNSVLGIYTSALYMGNIETGQIEEIYRPDQEKTLISPTPFITSSGEILISMVEGKRLGKEWPSEIQHFIVLFNLTKNKVIYSKEIESPQLLGAGFRAPVVNDGKVYTDIGKGIVCCDLETGTQLWSKSFNGDFLFSNFIVNDGFLYTNCENGYRYKLDANTGFVKWQELNTGTCTPIFMMNGVLYYIGGGDGKLYAVDAASGSIIWKESAPMDKNQGFSSVTPTGANGRIYCCDHFYAYCFEAAR